MVMIIDDEPDFIDVLTMALSDDYNLQTFTNPLEAVSIAANSEIRLVLTDFNMPQMSGIQVVKSIRQQNKTVPIVLVTGLGRHDDDVQEALLAGGTDVIVKPIRDLNHIGETIRKLIRI